MFRKHPFRIVFGICSIIFGVGLFIWWWGWTLQYKGEKDNQRNYEIGRDELSKHVHFLAQPALKEGSQGHMAQG